MKIGAFFFYKNVLIGQANAYSIQMLEFLPEHVKDALSHINTQFVYEIRLRANQPTTVNYQGVYRYLGNYGFTKRVENAVVCDGLDIAECVYRAGEYSVYSIEEQIKSGFITAKNGERIGLSGEYVFENGRPTAIRNFTSLCVRVPHAIQDCGKEIYTRCIKDGIKSLLIASPPGLGKTTILRDLARLISKHTQKNILICDERGEISCLDVGESCDVMKYADKKTAFSSGIRAMRPDIIITDELSDSDCTAVKQAVFAGVKVIASAHFDKMSTIQAPFFPLFERYVLLNPMKIGDIACVYDDRGREING